MPIRPKLEYKQGIGTFEGEYKNRHSSSQKASQKIEGFVRI